MLARPAVAVQCIWGRAWKRSDHWSCGMDKCWSLAGRSYWIPGSYAPTLSEKGNSFLRLLNNKAFREESMTKVELNAIGTSTTLESNKSPGKTARKSHKHYIIRAKWPDNQWCIRLRCALPDNPGVDSAHLRAHQSLRFP
jgi:hypothetical protein